MSRRVLPCAAVIIIALATVPLFAQEMEPRAFSPAPVGMQFLAVIYGYSEGDLVFDPTLPIEDAEASVNSLIVGYVRTFDLGGMTARWGVAAPWADGTATGLVAGAPRRRDVTGFGDPRITASLIFHGAPAMSPREFAKREKGSIAGVSLTVGAPLGEYDSDYAINLGTNRWLVRGSVGGSIQRGTWIFEGTAAGTFVTDNDNFYGGKRVEQDPIWSVQAHIVRETRTGGWFAFDSTWYRGGRTTTDGVPSSIRLENTRIGVTYTHPLKRGHSLKVAAATGVVTEIGTDFDQVLIAWQKSFMPRR